MFSIWVQPDYSVDATRSSYSIPTTFAAELNKLKEDSSVPVEPDKTLYPVHPVEGDNIGSLTIPALKRKLPILQGTGVKELKKGVGHFIQSVLPGEEDNCVLSGHRETVFRQIGKLKIGDLLIVQTSAGTFTYKVNGTYRPCRSDDDHLLSL
jgi:sortase A